MKLNHIKKISVFTSSLILLLSVKTVMAVSATTPRQGYTPLEPGFFGDMGYAASTPNLKAFLGLVFSFGIAIAAALAVVMIAWGGIQYMTTDSWSGKEDGKGKIENALYGLGLALISWLILYTINPTLVTFNNNSIL